MGHVGGYAQGIEAVWGDLGICGVGVRCFGSRGGGGGDEMGGEWAVGGDCVMGLQSSVQGPKGVALLLAIHQRGPGIPNTA